MNGSRAIGIWRMKSQTRAMTVLRLACVLRSLEPYLLGILTEVLDVLIGSQGHDTALLSGPHAGAVRLVDDNAIGDTGGDKAGAVGESSPLRVVVEGDVRQAVSQRGQQQGDVTSEPRKLEGLRESS